MQEGRPVWPEYDDSVMSSDDIVVDPTLPIQIGLDFGLTPAAVFGQRMASGRWNILKEIVTDDMGLERFGLILLNEINVHYPKQEILVWGDPAGQKRDEIFEVTAFDHLRTIGLNAKPTASNDFQVRREAAAMPMNRFIDKRVGLQVHKGCQRLRKSLAGGYHFKRVAVGGGHERFRDAANKNEHSHVGDAFGYLMLGGGEHKIMTRGHGGRYGSAGSQHQANVDFSVW